MGAIHFTKFPDESKFDYSFSRILSPLNDRKEVLSSKSKTEIDLPFKKKEKILTNI